MFKGLKIGLALSGSFCTFDRVIKVLDTLIENSADITIIMSTNSSVIDTRFGDAKNFIDILEKKSGKKIINTILDAEPIGPKKMFDILVVAPCTGNTISKLAYAITDTPVTMAVKSHLRTQRPVVIAVSTNDALSGCMESIARLFNRKHYFFVPMGQDAPNTKPFSVVAHMEKIPDTIKLALDEKQIQPIFI